MRDHHRATDRVIVDQVEMLHDGWSKLRQYRIRYRRGDGDEQKLIRETYDRGDGATILLYNKQRGTVILTAQFRMPAFVSHHPDGMLLETPAGLLDEDNPEDAIRREAEEETGYRIQDARKLFAAYMSPGSVTEQIHFFVAEYADADKVGAGGGHAHEGEDIDVLEVPMNDALAMIEDGRIVDAKTIILLYHARLKGLI
jgi:nudix-type nucleoside diphosphatase (YffH/AdpP family)